MRKRERPVRVFPSEVEFLAWRALNPGVGVRARAQECPLAFCLRERGAPDPVVSNWGWKADAENDLFVTPLPEWAAAWVLEFDSGDNT